MTVKINADTSDGLKFVSDTSGEIDLQTNGTTKVHMDSSGNVGIGYTSLTSKLTVNRDQSSGVADLLTLRDGSAGATFNMQTYSDPSFGTANRFDFSGAYLAFRRSGTEAMRIDSSGNLLCNSTSLGFANQTAVQIQTVSTGLISIQHLNTETNGSAYMWFTHNGGAIGSITQNGTTGISYNVNSDYRLKENVDYTFDATSRLKQLKPCRFNFKADTDRIVDGFIAHEVSDIVPEAVTGEKDATKVQDVYDDDGNVTGTETVPDYQGIDQSKLVPLLVKTCQEQQTIIEDLQTRITALESE
jgi:hypothetical protein